MSKYLGFFPTDEKEYFFISYNNEDASKISPLLADFSKQIPLWYDYGLEYGEDWNQQIADRIENAKAVIIIITKMIFQKGKESFVYKEYEMAKTFFHKKIYVIVAEKISNSDIPNALLSWWIDLNNHQCVNIWELNSHSEKMAEIYRIFKSVQKTDVKAYLIDRSGIRYQLKKGVNVLGRSPRKCTLVFDFSSKISMIHCCIVFNDDNRFFLQDMGATNATYLNRKPLQIMSNVSVKNGDIIGLSDSFELLLEIVED